MWAGCTRPTIHPGPKSPRARRSDSLGQGSGQHLSRRVREDLTLISKVMYHAHNLNPGQLEHRHGRGFPAAVEWNIMSAVRPHVSPPPPPMTNRTNLPQKPTHSKEKIPPPLHYIMSIAARGAFITESVRQLLTCVRHSSTLKRHIRTLVPPAYPISHPSVTKMAVACHPAATIKDPTPRSTHEYPEPAKVKWSASDSPPKSTSTSVNLSGTRRSFHL